MACFSCLEKCLPPLDVDLREDPMVDLEKAIRTAAWEILDADPPKALTWRERLSRKRGILRLEVDRSYFSVEQSGEMEFPPDHRTKPANGTTPAPQTLHNGDPANITIDQTEETELLPQQAELPDAQVTEETVSRKFADVVKVVGGPTCDRVLYGLKSPLWPQTEHNEKQKTLRKSDKNDTDSVQHYSFRTERSTKSSVQISLQKGFTLGETLELTLATPDLNLGKLGGELKWSFQRGKVTTHEDNVTWSVDNQIAVQKNKTGEAFLQVTERRWQNEFTVPCTVRPRTSDHTFPVFVRRKKSGDLVKVVHVTCSSVAQKCGDHIKANAADDMITCKVRGFVRVVSAVEQEVRLKEANMVPPETTPSESERHQ